MGVKSILMIADNNLLKEASNKMAWFWFFKIQ